METELVDRMDANISAVAANASLYTDARPLTIYPDVKSKSVIASLTAQLEQAQALINRQDARIAQLEVISTTDELTGLQNRRGLINAFNKDLDRCERGMSPGGLLVLIDLDNFKMINDTYGHAAGDACLRLVGKTLLEEVRVMDTAARMGGDEFVLLLCGTDKKRVAARVQKLVWRLNHLAVFWQGEEIAIHASVGLKEYTGGDCPKAIFQEADASMYANKRIRHQDNSPAEQAGAAI